MSVQSRVPELVDFFEVARTHPRRAALICSDGAVVSFATLAERVNQLSHALRSSGLRTGDCVAALVHNGQEYFELRLATWQSGLHFTPVDHHLAATEVEYIVQNSEARMLIVDRTLTGLGESALSAVPPHNRFAVGGAVGWRTYEDLFTGRGRVRPQDVVAGQVMLYTSGTTGRPKGVRRSITGKRPQVGQYHLDFMERLGIRPGEGVHLVLSPLYHAAPGTFSTIALHFGHTVVIGGRPEPEHVLRLIEEHGVTTTFTVPTVLHRLLRLSDEVRAKYDTSSLASVVHAGAPCPVHVKQAAIEWLGPVLSEFYGATEGSATAATSSEWLRKPGTVGYPLPGAQVRIFDVAGNRLGAGEVGSVYFRSGISDFEYFKDESKTAESTRGDFVTAGDVGYVDKDGWLFLHDRRTDLILSGGVNIYPAEVESVLLQDSAVADAAVIGEPDEEWGQSVLAIVQPVSEETPDVDLARRLTEHCREFLGGFKVPRRIEFTTRLPRTDTGKLLRRQLRDSV
ncbi:AMP-binding protein [Parasphingorhabdus pacifica]